MSEQLDLFPVKPVKLTGRHVTVQTIWGEERGIVLRTTRNHGHPMAEVLMDFGDTIYVNIARLTLLDEDDDG